MLTSCKSSMYTRDSVVEKSCSRSTLSNTSVLGKDFRDFEEKPSRWMPAMSEPATRPACQGLHPEFSLEYWFSTTSLESQEPPASRTCRHGLGYEQLWHMAWWILFRFSGSYVWRSRSWPPEEIAVWVKDGAYELSSHYFAFQSVNRVKMSATAFLSGSDSSWIETWYVPRFRYPVRGILGHPY